jgi:CubicO group peptidase (beta-lactamase class C family)
MKWLLVSISVLFCHTIPFAEEYWPGESDWQTIDPNAAGMKYEAMGRISALAQENNSGSLLVLRGGKIVLERYWAGHTEDTRLSIASSTKSMTAIMIGMALEEGKFKTVDQSISDFYTPWKTTPKENITLRHMLSMTSGMNSKGYSAGIQSDRDQFVHNATMPLVATPGTQWRYNTAAYHMLFRLLEKATGESMENYAEKKLFGPLGMNDTQWVKNKVGDLTNYYRVECTARDMARFGLFALRGGRWKEAQLISPNFFKDAITPSQEMNPAYGYFWWLNARKGKAPNRPGAVPRLRFPGSPSDTIACMGARGQNIMVVPSKDLVVVRQGTNPKDPGFQAKLLKMIVDSIRDHPDREPVGD